MNKKITNAAVENLTKKINLSLEDLAKTNIDFIKSLPVELNKLAIITDKLANMTLIGGQCYYNYSLDKSSTISSYNIDYRNNLTLSLQPTNEKRITLKENISRVLSTKRYILTDSDEELRSFNDLVVRDIPVIFKTTENTYKYIFELKNDSRNEFNKISVKLSKDTESYPTISEIYYINENKDKIQVKMINYGAFIVDLDTVREKDNTYNLVLEDITSDNIYIVLEDNKKNLGLDSIKIYHTKYDSVGGFVCKFPSQTKPILKVGLDYSGALEGVKTYVSNDNKNWYPILVSNSYSISTIPKVVSFNTIEVSSITTNTDVKDLYLKVELSPVEIPSTKAKTLNKGTYNTGNFAVQVTDYSSYSVYSTVDSYYYGRLSETTTNNLTWFFDAGVNYVKIDNIYYVKGFEDSVYSKTLKSQIDQKRVISSCQPKRVTSKVVDVDTIDITTADLYGFSIVSVEETPIQQNSNIVIPLKEEIPKGKYYIVQGTTKIECDLRLGYITSAIAVLFKVSDNKKVWLEDSLSNVVKVLTPDEFGFVSLLTEDMFVLSYDVDKYWPALEQTKPYTLLDSNLKTNSQNKVLQYKVIKTSIYNEKHISNLNKNYLSIKYLKNWKETFKVVDETLPVGIKQFKLKDCGVIKGSLEIIND
jgi:hypothetical protein